MERSEIQDERKQCTTNESAQRAREPVASCASRTRPTAAVLRTRICEWATGDVMKQVARNCGARASIGPADMTELNSDEHRREFAVERSHKDADKSNETIRSTAQAAILINGGAATAILAFLSKDGIDPFLYRVAPISLFAYAVGVAAGFAAMYCSIRSLDEYQQRWRLEAHPETDRSAEQHRRLGERWWKRMRACF